MTSTVDMSLEGFWCDDFLPLEAAGKEVLRELRRDEAAVDADLYRRIASNSSVGSHLYFPSTQLPQTSNGLKHIKSVALPPFLVQQQQTTRISSLMGILQPANLAWMTVDDKLYLWSINLAAGPILSDFSTFVVPSGQCIVTVGLAPPKQGVFKPLVKWCLVVTTPDECILCALTQPDDHSFDIVPTRYSVPTDKVPIVSIGSNPDGRIFLGGYDGSIFEMAYESLVRDPPPKPVEEQWNDFYDGKAPLPQPQPSFTGLVYQQSKRTISALVSDGSRPRKCRKLNHSSTPFSSLVTSVVPDVLVQATSLAGSYLFGSMSSDLGPVVQILHDDERNCLYTLSARGFIGVYDLRKQQIVNQKALFNAPSTARSYLESVARGHMHPPTPGTIRFPGGGAAAQAGVGGMEGARNILKLADNTRTKSTRSSTKPSKSTNVLTPVSIHLIPRSESSRLSLIAITSGGLRYYLSSLNPAVISSGTTNRRRVDPLAPHISVALCYIRAPPPLDARGTDSNLHLNSEIQGLTPKLERNASSGQAVRLDVGFYQRRLTFMAMESSVDASNRQADGDTVLGMLPDVVARKKTITNGNVVPEVPGGVCEVLARPMHSSTTESKILPGGRVMAVCAVSPAGESTRDLLLNSQTPTDGELSVGMVPAFIPSSVKGSTKLGKAERAPLSSSRAITSTDTAQVSRGKIVRADGTSVSSSSVALTVLANFMLSRPLRYGLEYQATSGTRKKESVYHISARSGSSGFSSSVAGKLDRSSGSSVSLGRSGLNAHKSARLSPWLLRPAAIPLSQFATHHLDPSVNIMAINSGGMHFFRTSSVLKALEDAIMNAGDNVGRDEGVSAFFASYGHKEGCSMCLMLVVQYGQDEGVGSYNYGLRQRASSAAFSRSFVPRLDFSETQPGTMASMIANSTTDYSVVPKGYVFVASSLYEGLISVMSRLLRPIWHKPFCVVTEGQAVRTHLGSKTYPAKVELLLDDEKLNEVRRPLRNLMDFMKDKLAPAIGVVPGLRRNNLMDLDDQTSTRFIGTTGTMIFQNQLRNQRMATNGQLSVRACEMIAQLIEERNIHSAFRLLSRTIQLLNLFSHLKRAHYARDLPQVEWGLLHGLTVAQLVEKREAHERMEALLNSIVSSHGSTSSQQTPTADTDKLTQLLASECYLYFSPGSRFAWIGFRAATEALSYPPQSARRAALSSQASAHLKRAAKFWHSAPLVTGRALRGGEDMSIEQIARWALEHESPLAKAASVLRQLEDVVGLVNVCLTSASNFVSQPASTKYDEEDKSGHLFDWERGLYHKQSLDSQEGAATNTPTSPSSSTAVVVGVNVTTDDATRTCHAIILEHLCELLVLASNSHGHELGERMLAVCAASTDEGFLTTMFRHLLNKDFVEILLRINSTELEKFLKDPSMDPNLLWQYYGVQGRHALAGQLMWHRACAGALDVPLDERLDCLTKSLNSYRTALHKAVQSGQVKEKEELQRAVTRVQETLDVGVFQTRILHTVNSTAQLESMLERDTVLKLRSSLLPVSDLYNDYAAPLHLFDSCLLILHSCRHNAPPTIESLWRSILCEEILPCATRSRSSYGVLQRLMTGSLLDEKVVLLTDDDQDSGNLPLIELGEWLERLQIRVTTLGQEIYGQGADYAFPVAFLVEHLEDLRHCVSSTHGGPWPLRVMLDVGVPMEVLFSAYEAIVSSEEKKTMLGGGTPRETFFSVLSMVELLEEWVFRAQQKGIGILQGSLQLISRIDKAKAGFEAFISAGTASDTDAARHAYQRLLAVESTLK